MRWLLTVATLALVQSTAFAQLVMVSGTIRGDDCTPLADPNIPGTCPIVSGGGFTIKAFLDKSRGADCCDLAGCGSCYILYEFDFDQPFTATPTAQFTTGDMTTCSAFDVSPTAAKATCSGAPPHDLNVTATGMTAATVTPAETALLSETPTETASPTIPTQTTTPPAPTTTAMVNPIFAACAGNCNDDSAVTVDEILTMINVALGNTLSFACKAGDANHDDRITIDEILAAVTNALYGCGGGVTPPTPMPTRTRTSTLTPTLTATRTATPTPTPLPAAGWVKYEGNPVLGGPLGTVFDISVLREGDTYRMWFSWRPKRSIALVESRDGVHWSEPLIVLGPNADTDWEADTNRPVVVKRSDGYHLWYTGQARGHSWIGYATSADGRTWKRMSDQPVLSPEEPWEGVAVMCPHVIWDEEARQFQLWYSAGEQYEPDAIGFATSPDGLHWTKRDDNPVFTGDPNLEWEHHKVTACQVVRHGDWYLMFYVGFRDGDHAQIGLARSRDGIANWERLPANPIIRPGEDQWDEIACYKPFAIFDGQRWLLWYNGRGGGSEQIGLAIHQGEALGFPADSPH